MNQQSFAREYPNAKVRLRLSRKGPALPVRESYMDIWTKGTRFRVRDESGRDVASILGDISAARGLGAAPHSMEEIMDIWAQSHMGEATPGATELYGDLATGKGLVYRRGQAAWPIAADTLAPSAEQILVGGLDKQLELRRRVIHLGRPSTEYHGFLEGKDQGMPYKSEVTRVVLPPYLLFSSVCDAQNADYWYTREVVSLDEGAVTDLDLTPPESGQVG